MKPEKSRTVLKVLGVLTILMGALTLLASLIVCAAFALSFYETGMAGLRLSARESMLAIALGVTLLLGSSNQLAQGIFALRVSRSGAGVRALWRCSILGFFIFALLMLYNLTRDGLLMVPILGFLINSVYFLITTKILNRKGEKPVNEGREPHETEKQP